MKKYLFRAKFGTALSSKFQGRNSCVKYLIMAVPKLKVIIFLFTQFTNYM